MPSWPGVVSAFTATAAMSRGSIGVILPSPAGENTAPCALIEGIQLSALEAKAPGRTKVQARPEASSFFSLSRCQRSIWVARSLVAPNTERLTTCATPAFFAASKALPSSLGPSGPVDKHEGLGRRPRTRRRASRARRGRRGRRRRRRRAWLPPSPGRARARAPARPPRATASPLHCRRSRWLRSRESWVLLPSCVAAGSEARLRTRRNPALTRGGRSPASRPRRRRRAALAPPPCRRGPRGQSWQSSAGSAFSWARRATGPRA